ncbi:hypothetical protein V5O48_004719 [Marasmius crinis-equi]|uniref:Protein-S-isoprenylcysteine O-methyltransferase n=1 Tax=Marasmius crinis-equi TaxID=585013 RepID=A0ABR3FPC0_9AGAR
MFFELLKFSLIVFSAFLVKRCYTPPLGITKVPSVNLLTAPWPQKREYIIMGVFVSYVFPFQRITYAILILLESVFIFTKMSPHFSAPLVDVKISANSTTTPLFPNHSSRSDWLGMSGLLVGVAGGIFRMACYRALGAGFTYDIPKVSEGERPAPKLVTRGPYSFVRHPSYLGLWIISIGFPLYHLSSGSWIVESGFLDWNVALGLLELPLGRTLVYLWVAAAILGAWVISARANDEDALMKKEFGAQWEEWRQRVKYRVLPFVY